MGRGMNGTGMNGAGMGVGARDGSCLDPANLLAKGTLTEAQQGTLAAMAQEEKTRCRNYIPVGVSLGLDRPAWIRGG
jgi:hypothetical protein